MNRRNLLAGIAALPLLALPSGGQASAAELGMDDPIEQFKSIAFGAYEEAKEFLEWYAGDGRGDRFNCIFNVYVPMNLYDVRRSLEFDGPTYHAALDFHVDKFDVGLFNVLVLPTFDFFIFRDA